jgi:ribosomal protein S27AE
VIELTTSAVCSPPSWRVEENGQEAAAQGACAWRHDRSGAVISLVVAGLHPLIVVAGPGGLSGLGPRDGGPSALSVTARWHTRGALRRLTAAARGAGGRWVLTARLPDLVRMAGERLEWRVAVEHRLEELAQLETTRQCPRCAVMSAAGARWCGRCEYEFSGADDHALDLQNAQRRQEAEGLRNDLARLQLDEFPPLVSAGPVMAPRVPGRGSR